MKKLYLIILLAGIISTGFSQNESKTVEVNSDENSNKSLKFNIGPEIGFPIGNNSASYSLLLGITSQLEIVTSSKVSILVHAGYLNFSYKTVKNNGNQGFIPLLAGIRYYISPRAFINLKGGVAFAISNIIDESGIIIATNGSYFAYSPGIGHKFGKKLEGEFKFLGISNSQHNHLNSFALRFAYTL